MNAYESIDLSGVPDTGPDGMCTAVSKTKVRSYIYETEQDSLLILNGQVGTADIAGSIGAICIIVNGRFCAAQSVLNRYASASGSCIMPIPKGTNTFRIVGVHNLGLSRFQAGFVAFPL